MGGSIWSQMQSTFPSRASVCAVTRLSLAPSSRPVEELESSREEIVEASAQGGVPPTGWESLANFPELKHPHANVGGDAPRTDPHTSSLPLAEFLETLRGHVDLNLGPDDVICAMENAAEALHNLLVGVQAEQGEKAGETDASSSSGWAEGPLRFFRSAMGARVPERHQRREEPKPAAYEDFADDFTEV